jgi:carbonic anhydrase
LILVLGHTDCGAIKAAIDGAELGNITAMLQNIQPAIAATTHYEGDRNSSNKDYVRQIARMNVQLSVKRIRERSAILKEMEDNDEIRIVGALYDMKTGIVEFIN